MHSFGGRPRERIQILLWIIQSSLLSKLWVRCFWLGDLDIQIFSSYGDRSQISQMKVTDGWGTVCCHHSAKKKGSSWLQVILLSYGLFRTESEWGVVASIQWKARLASVFTTLQILSSKGVGWVTVCSLPSFSDMKASFGLVGFFLCLSLVMEVLDLSLLDISIWTWEWNSSW